MRLIGHLASEEHARVFGDYLLVQGIENQVDHEHGDGWGLWIHDEDKVERATSLLTEFQANPGEPKYETGAKAAADLRSEKQKEEEHYQNKVRNRRHLFRPLKGYKFGPLTFVLICMSGVVFLLSNFGENLENLRKLFIIDPLIGGTLLEVRRGEVWRLVTPIFIHFGWLHVIFNLMWLADLGSMVEGRQSTWFLLVFVLVIAVASNLGQYFVSGPVFGGMSGVVYGLLGYIWIRGKFDPASGLFLHPTTVTLMIVWFVLGFTGVFRVANTAHAAGLLLGMGWGYLASLRHR
ncbi:MAG TPA: rhomboid family intramembrane serine protease [Clostridia bacterium]|nr:rhomboid family intramembrane serine protease [Clostridia bacterium]